MRALLIAALSLAVALVCGCASGGGSAADQTSNLCALQVGGRNVLFLTAPSVAESTMKDGFLHLKSREGEVEIWRIRGAQSIDDGVRRVDKEISSEFKKFNPTKSTPLTIANAPATRLEGTGTEADDGDPGDADVVVFKVGDNIFIACTHGENLPASARRWMMSLLQTAQKP